MKITKLAPVWANFQGDLDGKFGPWKKVKGGGATSFGGVQLLWWGYQVSSPKSQVSSPMSQVSDGGPAVGDSASKLARNVPSVLAVAPAGDVNLPNSVPPQKFSPKQCPPLVFFWVRVRMSFFEFPPQHYRDPNCDPP